MNGLFAYWQNGGKPILIAFLAFMTAMLLLMAAATYPIVSYVLRDNYEPLYGYDVQQVLDPVVPVGHSVRVQGTRCSHEAVSVTGHVDWRRLSGPDLVVDVGANPSRVAAVGCTTTIFENVMPLGVTAGTWQIEGYSETHRGTQTQVVAWHTTPFTVIQ